LQPPDNLPDSTYFLALMRQMAAVYQRLMRFQQHPLPERDHWGMLEMHLL
jgi:hypothetical protein